MHVWTTDERVKHIVTRKFLRFTLCDLCVQFITERQQQFSNRERSQLRDKEMKHYQDVRRERQGYWKRRLKAITNPHSHWSLIVDGASQSAFAAPHLLLKAK